MLQLGKVHRHEYLCEKGDIKSTLSEEHTNRYNGKHGTADMVL